MPKASAYFYHPFPQRCQLPDSLTIISRITFFLLLLFTYQSIVAQDSIPPKKWRLNGYVKDLLILDINDETTNVSNLVHNRFNFEWFPTSSFTTHLEVRNRLFNGDQVEETPQYGKLIDVNNDYFDLSYYAPEEKSWLFHTMIDRAYVEWYRGQWEFRAGRQRINWGMNLIWNPNDLFNAYSFFDFDYEERPGSDAIRIKKYTGFASSIEVAGNISDDFDETVLALMRRINVKGYDIQFIGGKAREDLTIATGWAGNIKNAGFKGEVSYFYPYKDNSVLTDALLASFSADYSFENSLYLHGSVLYNSDGSDDQFLGGAGFISSGKLTARNLSPFKYSTLLQTSYSFNPLMTGGVALIFYPGKRNGLFINPSVSYSVQKNLDLDLISQIYFDQLNDEYQVLARLIYIRLKWSF